jgi:hypothetical protein
MSIFASAQDEPPALAEHERWITSLVFSPDSSLLASTGGESLLYRDGDVKLWNPATGEEVEGFAFLEFAADSDLTWRSLPDHTPQAFALVEEALAEKILDPDALTTAAAVADSPAVTLTLLWYDRRIRPGSPRAFDRHDWAVLQMLVAANADLTADDAATLREDLAKIVIDDGGRFIGLEWGEIETPPEPEPEIEAAPVEDAPEDTGAE